MAESMEGVDVQTESVLITINYKGEDILCDVNIETANILLNDPEEAAKFVENLRNTDDREPFVENSLWCSKQKQNLRDHDATLRFLELRAKYNEKFNNKKTLKAGLWKQIAQDMKAEGFNIGEGKEAGEKCRQKFANLQRTYMNHISHMKTTGERKKDPPPYFNEMHNILGWKDKVNPPYLEDSLNLSSSISEALLNTSDTTNSDTDNHTHIKKDFQNRFKSSSTTVRPQSTSSKILEYLEGEKIERAQHYKVIEDALKTQNEQRERLLQILERTFCNKENSP